MNLTIFHRRRAERFAQLLDEDSDGGCRHHVRSRLDDQLAELVAIGHQARAMRPNVELDPEFRSGLRAMLVATAERDGIGSTASVSEKPERSRSTRSLISGRPTRVRARGAVIVGVAVGAIAVSGMSAASENAIPGDPLYGMKRSAERAQLALAGSDLTRGQLYLDFAHTRMAEAAAVRNDPQGFAAVLRDMDADTQHGVRLLTSSAVGRRNPAALDAVGSFVGSQRLALGGLLEQLPAGSRDRALESLALLDSVAKRADALRPTLNCGGSASAGADHLGPKPRQCTAAALPDDTDRDRGGQRSVEAEAPAHRRTERSESTPASVGSSATGAPVASKPASRLSGSAPTTTPAPRPRLDPEDDNVLTEVGKILGDLLG